MQLGFATWVSDTPSGGNLYDRKLIENLRALGVEVAVRRIGGHWPGADEHARADLWAALNAEPRTLVDGMLAGDAPELVEAAVDAGRSVTIVVHHFGTDRPELSAAERTRLTGAEARALGAATGVICTSHWAAAELARRYGLVDTGVAVPGVVWTEPSRGSLAVGRARFLMLGSVTSTKNQLGLASALSRIKDLDWSARLVGGDTVDPDYTVRVRAAITDHGLTDRVAVTGPLVGAELAAEWFATDLLVHPSWSETYGIVVLEALAHGVPAVVVSGTGAVEALAAGRDSIAGPQAGTVVAPGDAAGLAGMLRTWLTDPSVQRAWRGEALRRRTRLPSWSQTAASALDYLRRSQGGRPA